MNTSQDDRNEGQSKLDKSETALISFEIETDRADQRANIGVEDPDVAVLDPINKLETHHTLLSTATQITKNWLASGLIGTFVVSYWRGTWTLFDIWYVQFTPATLRWECSNIKVGYPKRGRHSLTHSKKLFYFPTFRWCDQPKQASLTEGETFCFASDFSSETRRDSAWKSYGMGLGLLALGVMMMWSGTWLPKKADCDLETKLSRPKVLIRFLLVYILGLSSVQQWRGIWYLTDYYVFPNNIVKSYWVTAGVGPAVLFCLFAGASILASPALFLLDGPGIHPPPLAVTIVSSYFSLKLPAQAKPPTLHGAVYAADALVSFIVVPIMVVWYFRGAWGLLDHYLWGFSADGDDLNRSLGTGTAITVACLATGSDNVMLMLPKLSNRWNQVLGRLRTLVLALGAVSFWRTVWYCLDTFFVFDSSAWLSHVVGVVGLTAMGCFSSVAASGATLAVDAVACADCAATPLFSSTPVSSEKLHFFGIGRNPTAQELEDWEQEQEQDR